MCLGLKPVWTTPFLESIPVILYFIFLTELLFNTSVCNLCRWWHGVHKFSVWACTNIPKLFPCCLAETCATEESVLDQGSMRKWVYSIIYAPLTKFMVPLGGHAVVLCLLLLAVVHCCILMDMSNNESFWQCSKELASLAQRNKTKGWMMHIRR